MRLLWKSRLVAGLFATMVGAGCSAYKSASTNSPTSPITEQRANVRVLDVLTGAAVSGAAVAGSGLTGGTTDSGGGITLTAPAVSTYGIGLSSSLYVTRNTLIKLPGADATVSLIRNNFNLVAFNEMYRGGGDATLPPAIVRWTSAPVLRIASNVVDASGTSYTATSEPLTPDEINSIKADLTRGLTALSGGMFTEFSGVTIISLAAGESFSSPQQGSITFARCRGVTEATMGAAGFAQTLFFDATSVMVGAQICVDRDFELSGSTQGLAVRLHELGHALGARHVEPSVMDDVLMNPSIKVTDLTTWDRDAAHIAYQRPPGSVAPDNDPASYSANRLVLRMATTAGCKVRRP